MVEAISTHAPRTGSDLFRALRRAHIVISTHAPRTGSDETPPERGAAGTHFNPRSPHGERPYILHLLLIHPNISTHAPRTGSDAQRHIQIGVHNLISTHAPRTGSDGLSRRPGFRASGKFQPTLPARGATCPENGRQTMKQNFNPRSPHGERPAARRSGCMCRAISTHAPRTGSDAFPCPASRAYSNFNPRSPHGERQGCR